MFTHVTFPGSDYGGHNTEVYASGSDYEDLEVKMNPLTGSCVKEVKL